MGKKTHLDKALEEKIGQLAKQRQLNPKDFDSLKALVNQGADINRAFSREHQHQTYLTMLAPDYSHGSNLLFEWVKELGGKFFVRRPMDTDEQYWKRLWHTYHSILKHQNYSNYSTYVSWLQSELMEECAEMLKTTSIHSNVAGEVDKKRTLREESYLPHCLQWVRSGEPGEDIKTVKWLLDHGAITNPPPGGVGDYTPLQHHVASKHFTTAMLLLDYGADHEVNYVDGIHKAAPLLYFSLYPFSHQGVEKLQSQFWDKLIQQALSKPGGTSQISAWVSATIDRIHQEEESSYKRHLLQDLQAFITQLQPYGLSWETLTLDEGLRQHILRGLCKSEYEGSVNHTNYMKAITEVESLISQDPLYPKGKTRRDYASAKNAYEVIILAYSIVEVMFGNSYGHRKSERQESEKKELAARLVFNSCNPIGEITSPEKIQYLQNCFGSIGKVGSINLSDFTDKASEIKDSIDEIAIYLFLPEIWRRAQASGVNPTRDEAKNVLKEVQQEFACMLLSRFSIGELFGFSESWHANRAALIGPDVNGKRDCIRDFVNEFTWSDLTPPQSYAIKGKTYTLLCLANADALKEEGRKQKICIDGQTYINNGNEGKAAYYSIRDEKGHILSTAEFQLVHDEEKTPKLQLNLVQHKAHRNSKPIAEVSAALSQFMQDFNTGVLQPLPDAGKDYSRVGTIEDIVGFAITPEAQQRAFNCLKSDLLAAPARDPKTGAMLKDGDYLKPSKTHWLTTGQRMQHYPLERFFTETIVSPVTDQSQQISLSRFINIELEREFGRDYTFPRNSNVLSLRPQKHAGAQR